MHINILKATRILYGGMLACFITITAADAQQINTVGGDGTTGITGSGIGAANSVAIDSAGNIYVSAGGRNIIRKITPAGAYTTFAGTGAADFSGDNGTATAATFHNIQDLYIANGALYVADGSNRRIRKIDLTSQTVTTVAGDGTTNITGSGIGAAAGVAVDAAGNIYVAGGGMHVIRKVTPAGVYSTFAGTGTPGYAGDNGTATGAMLNQPNDLFISNGQLYIADVLNRRIRKVDLSNNIITTVAGDGTTNITGSGIGAAIAVAADGGNNVYVATGAAGHLIRKIAGTDYSNVTAAGNGAFSGDNGDATDAALHLPADLNIQGSSLYIADEGNRRIRTITNSAIPLPLTLLSFTAAPDRQQTVLTWHTTNQYNVNRFVVERSANGKDFDMIQTISATTTPDNQQTYTTKDSHPFPGRNCYRLKMLDNDGQYTYSPVAQVLFEQTQTLSVSPVPATRYLKIEAAAASPQTQDVAIFNATGACIAAFTLSRQPYYLDISNYTAGIYFLQYGNGHFLKWVKQ